MCCTSSLDMAAIEKYEEKAQDYQRRLSELESATAARDQVRTLKVVQICYAIPHPNGSSIAA